MAQLIYQSIATRSGVVGYAEYGSGSHALVLIVGIRAHYFIGAMILCKNCLSILRYI